MNASFKKQLCAVWVRMFTYVLTLTLLLSGRRKASLMTDTLMKQQKQETKKTFGFRGHQELLVLEVFELHSSLRGSL